MTDSLAALAAMLLGWCLPRPASPLPSPGLLLAVLTVPPATASGRAPCGFLGLPGDWTPMTGGGAP